MDKLSPSEVWLIVLVICLVIEAITLGLTTIWFAAGAFVTCIVSLFVENIGIQIAVFFTTSIILLYLTRPIVMKYLTKNKIKTNYEEVLNKTGIVTQTIDNLKDTGLIKINGQIWTARSLEKGIIAKDEIVIINEIKGVKAYVTKKSM